MILKKDYTFILSEKLPEATRGKYSIIKKTIDRGSFIRTYTPAGFFYHDRTNADMPTVVLLEGDSPLMSDSPMEQEGIRIPVIAARGSILVIGLGIGLYPTMVRARNRTVKKITIVEENEDVVRLVYPHTRNRRTDIRVCEGKKFLMSCKEKYDYIYIDVWDAFITTVKEIDEWTELAKPCLTDTGMVRCWLQELYDRVKDKLPKEPIVKTQLAGMHDPCLICGKKLRFDYAGLCMDCADMLGVSEAFIR